MEILTELVKILADDAYLLENKVKFLDSLGISGAIVGPWMKLFDMGHCKPYDLIKHMLSEWISIKNDSATIAELRRILREDGFLKVSDSLDGLQKMHPGPIKIPELEISRRNDPLGIPQPHSSGNPPPKEVTKRPITFGLKSVVQNFTGREEELGRLNEYFHSGETPFVLISGLGGIGKTELAKKFILDISDPSGNALVKFWLSGESSQSLQNSTGQFCQQLQLPSKWSDGQPLGMQEMIQNILTKLKSSEEFMRWVVIIDNVDDIHEEFETAVQSLSEFGPDVFLLVTSRRRDIYEGEVELLELTEMQLENSMEFLRKTLKISDNSSEGAIKSLCETLGNFPLALNQAAAFIRQQQSSTLKGRAYKIENYLEELTKNEKLGLDKDRKLGYSTATLAVWNITLDKIRDYGTEGQVALDLLDAMAFIKPDDISIQFLHKLYKRFYDIEETVIVIQEIQESLTLLLKYSLISSNDEVMNIHRLVQLALRDRMSSKSQSSKGVEILTKFWTSFDHEEWNRMEVQNILTIWNHTSQNKELDEHRAAKITKVWTQVHKFGMVNEAYDFAIEGSKFILDLYGVEHKLYFAMEYSLALAMNEKGQHESALLKFTTLYWKFKELGVDDDVTLKVGYYVAASLYNLKRFEESLELGETVMQSQIRIYSGEENKTVMITINLVALALKQLGKGIEAMQIQLQILEWKLANLGANHPLTLTTRHNMAICFYTVGRFAEALGVFQEVLPLLEQILGSDHPETLVTKECMADTLFKMVKMDQAVNLWEEVLVASEKVLGVEHPQSIKVQGKLTLFKDKMNCKIRNSKFQNT